MRRILFLLLIAFAFSPAVEISRSQSSGQGQNSRINLSGIWEDAGEQVTITDSRGSVTARYSNQKQCRHDESVTPYTSGFVVSGTGSTLGGTGTICYWGGRDPDSPAPRGVKQDSQVTLTVSADGKTLTGTQVSYHGPISFTLTRKCEGVLYASTLDGRIYSEPSTTSTVLGSPPSGSRLCYTSTTNVNGQTWYYVEPPGRPAGWMPDRQLSPNRPVNPPIPKIIKPLDPGSGLDSDRPTAAQTSGGRG